MPTTLDLAESTSNATTRRMLSALSMTVAKSKKVVVVTGAGISCSCGIPDFRSSDGLYNIVKQQYPDVVLKGRDLFDSSLFRDPTSTSVFYTFVSKLKQSIDHASPSSTHNFIKTLDAKGRLVRSYTQNIDGLEERAGLLGSSSVDAQRSSGEKGKGKLKMKEVKNVQLHGSIHRVRCTFCSADLDFTREYGNSFDGGAAPDCPECTSRSKARVARSARALKIGKLRPAIVLYDEPHPLGDEIGTIETADLTRRPDLLIIMGTSLKVHGLKKLVKEFAKALHESPSRISQTKKNMAELTASGSPAGKAKAMKVIFVNKTAPSAEWEGVIDCHVQGETDAWVERVLEDWKRMRPADWEVQTKLVGEGGAEENSATFKASKKGTKVNVGAKKVSKKFSKKIDTGGDSENIPPSLTPHRSEPESSSRFVDLSKSPSLSLGSPMSIVTSPPSSIPIPLSPSKRRQETSHYSKLESSPSKRRTGRNGVSGDELIPQEERRLLFGGNQSMNMNMSVEIDFGELEMVKKSLQTNGLAVGAMGTRRSLRKARSAKQLPLKEEGIFFLE